MTKFQQLPIWGGGYADVCYFSNFFCIFKLKFLKKYLKFVYFQRVKTQGGPIYRIWGMEVGETEDRAHFSWESCDSIAIHLLESKSNVTYWLLID